MSMARGRTWREGLRSLGGNTNGGGEKNKKFPLLHLWRDLGENPRIIFMNGGWLGAPYVKRGFLAIPFDGSTISSSRCAFRFSAR